MPLCKISVIIAAYNTAEYLAECLDSIFNQTLKEIEVILIDDGSTDNTSCIIEKYLRQHNNFITHYQKNAGAGKARNYGITLAKGEYMAFMDSDDKYPCSDCLEKQYFTAKEQNALICGGNIICNDNGVKRNLYIAGQGDAEHTENQFIDVYNYFFLYGHQRYLFSTKLIKDNQIEYAAYSRYEDQVFTVKAFGIAKKFYEMNYPVYEYRINHKQVKYDKDMCCNVLSGVRDTYNFIIKYNLRLMFVKNYWKDIESQIKLFIDYLFCGNAEVDQVLQDINELARRSNWENNEDHYITCNKISEYRKCMQIEKAKLDCILMGRKPIIIYGAGTNTKKLILAYRDRMQSVIGIAVSSLTNNNRKCEGINVNTIEQYSLYKESAVILVTPSEKYRDDIIKTLEEIGFKNYEWVDMSMIH